MDLVERVKNHFTIIHNCFLLKRYKNIKGIGQKEPPFLFFINDDLYITFSLIQNLNSNKDQKGVIGLKVKGVHFKNLHKIFYIDTGTDIKYEPVKIVCNGEPFIIHKIYCKIEMIEYLYNK